MDYCLRNMWEYGLDHAGDQNVSRCCTQEVNQRIAPCARDNECTEGIQPGFKT